MKTNNVMLLLMFVSLFSLMLVSCEQAEKAEQPATQKPSVERTSEYTLSAMVDAVDTEARSLTLKDEEGVTHTFQHIRPDVPLEKLVVGKAVTMTVYQKEINYAVAEGEEIPADEAIRTVGAKKGEEERNITIVQAENMTTTVKEIDLENRMVTLMMEDGTPMTLPVQDDVKNLENLEIGDKVVTQVTQVIMVTMDE
jgi:Cu/Ag efflux protein CusF